MTRPALVHSADMILRITPSGTPAAATIAVRLTPRLSSTVMWWTASPARTGSTHARLRPGTSASRGAPLVEALRRGSRRRCPWRCRAGARPGRGVRRTRGWSVRLPLPAVRGLPARRRYRPSRSPRRYRKRCSDTHCPSPTMVPAYSSLWVLWGQRVALACGELPQRRVREAPLGLAVFPRERLGALVPAWGGGGDLVAECRRQLAEQPGAADRPAPLAQAPGRLPRGPPARWRGLRVRRTRRRAWIIAVCWADSLAFPAPPGQRLQQPDALRVQRAETVALPLRGAPHAEAPAWVAHAVQARRRIDAPRSFSATLPVRAANLLSTA